MLNIASIIVIAVTGIRYFDKWMLLYFSWNGRRVFLEEISNVSCNDIVQCKCTRGTCQSKCNTMLHLSWKNTLEKNFEHSQLRYSHRNDFVLYWTWHKSNLYNGFLSIPLYQTGQVYAILYWLKYWICYLKK